MGRSRWYWIAIAFPLAGVEERGAAAINLREHAAGFLERSKMRGSALDHRVVAAAGLPAGRAA